MPKINQAVSEGEGDRPLTLQTSFQPPKIAFFWFLNRAAVCQQLILPW